MIKRDILNPLLGHLREKEISVITGSRQVGKTYLMRLMQDELKQKGEPTLYLNLDIEQDRLFFNSQGDLIQKIQLETGKSKGYIFIDEIQRKQDAGLFLKGLYDMNLPYKFVVSGSGSIELKEKIHESLAGRKQIFIVDPVNLGEFVNFKTGYQYTDRIDDLYTVEKDATRRILEEYIVFGGYPKVVLAENVEKKNQVMREIFESYVEKDIRNLLDVEKPQAFTALLKIIASQIGGIVNISEISSTIGISNKTVNSYLWYLEKTFILHKVSPYFTNVRKEITKAPIYYFYDQGLRNYLLGLFGNVPLPSSMSGHLFENLVFNSLRQSNIPLSDIHFWRSRDNAEVDFVVQKGFEVTPIEVKYKELKSPEISRSFRSFISTYKPKKAFVIHKGQETTDQLDTTKVVYLPYHAVSKNYFF